MGNKGSKDKKVEKQKPEKQLQELNDEISALQKEMEELGEKGQMNQNPLYQQRRNSLQGQMDGLQRVRGSTIALQKAKGNNQIQEAKKKQQDDWAEYKNQKQMQQQPPLHNYNQRPRAQNALLPLFKEMKPEQQLKAVDNQMRQWQDDAVHRNSLEQLKRVRASTVIIMDDQQDDEKREEAQKQQKIDYHNLWMKEQQQALLHFQKLQKQVYKPPNVKPKPMVNWAKACETVKRPNPMTLGTKNMEQFSAFANAGLLVRIANGLGHGSCTATLLQDGQTLVTAGHCVGLLDDDQKEKTFSVNKGADALRWCPMYSKESQGGVSQTDLFYCPFVRKMYVFKAWRETADEANKNNRQYLVYDIGVLKLNKHIDDFQIEMAKSGKSWKKQYGFVIGGLPFNYIQTKEIDQMVDSPHKIIVEQKQDVETSPQKDLNGHAVEAQPLFGEANAYTAQLAVAGYPVDSNNQLYLYMWTVNVDPRDKHNKYPMCMYSLANRRKGNPWKDTRITFPIKTNHGASGSSLIHLTGNGAGYVIGVLSAGNRVQGKERTAFRLFDLHAVRMITAVQQGYDSILSYNTNEKDVNYKIVGWEAIEPQLGEFKGWAALDMAGTVSNARAMDGAFDNYYDSVAMDGGYRTFNGYNDGYANLHTAILLFILVVFCCVMCMVSTACFGVGCFIFGHKVSSKSKAKPIAASSEDEV
eukprot:35393_1